MRGHISAASAVIAAVACFGSGSAAATSHAGVLDTLARPPTTLATVSGFVEGFAQDGNHIVWATESGRCGRNVVLRTLSTGRSTFLDSRDGPMCRLIEIAGEVQPWMALAGTRALWAREFPSLSLWNFSVFTAAPGGPGERQVGGSALLHDPSDEHDGLRPVPMSGHGKTLLFADISDEGAEEESGPSGVYRVNGKHVQHVAGTRGAFSVAVAGSSFALARAIPAGCACNTSPAWSPDGRRIAFISGEDGTAPQLFVMNADGTDRRRVLNDTTSLAWSPGAAFFAANQSREVVIVKSDGSGLRTVARADGTDFAWSSDGRMLAYFAVDKRKGERHLFIVAASGGKPIDYPADEAYEPPQWSPNSQQVAFERDVGNGPHVYVAAANGGTPVDLGVGYAPRWAPDGSLIAVEREDGAYAVAPDGSANRRLGPRGDLSPDWKWIAYGTPPPDGPDARDSDLWLVSTAGGPPRPLAHGDTIGGWGWSPDSRSIAYSRWTTRDSDVVDPAFEVVDLETGSRRPMDPNLVYFPLEWSPDGARLVCVAPTGSGDWDEGEIAVVETRTGTSSTITHTEPKPARSVVETRGGSSVLSRFEAPGRLDSVAWSGSRFALLIPRSKTQARIEIRSASGKLLRSVNVPRPWFDQFSMSGRWVVFRAGSSVRLVDASSGRMTVLAQAPKASIIGLSIDGRRVAWAESAYKRSRIRAVLLPVS